MNTPLRTILNAAGRLCSLVLSAVIGGAVALSLAHADPAVPLYDVVRAKRFEMVDQQGGIRAVLYTGSDSQAHLTLNDVDGTPRLDLHADGFMGESGLLLFNDLGKVGLNLRQGGALAYPNVPGVHLNGREGNLRLWMTLVNSEETPGLVLFDASGNVLKMVKP